MVYANVEYLSKAGEWLTFESLASARGELLVLAIAGLVNRFKGCATPWRIRIRH